MARVAATRVAATRVALDQVAEARRVLLMAAAREVVEEQQLFTRWRSQVR